MPGLTPQQVEVLRRRRAIGDADVALRAEREETLQSGARMLRALAFVSMGQEQRQARRLPPLHEARDDELVEDYLAAIREIAVLRLPQHQCLRGRHRVAVLEAHARELGKRAVV